MSRINLLPWREWERARRNRVFVAALIASGAGALGVALAATAGIDQAMARQDDRAAFLRNQLAVLDERVLEVARLRTRREELAAHLEGLRALRDERVAFPGMLEALASTIPPGIHYTRVTRTAAVLSISGTAVAATRISVLMRRLAASERFGTPVLRGIQEDQDNAAYGGRGVRFELSLPWRTNTRPTEDD